MTKTRTEKQALGRRLAGLSLLGLALLSLANPQEAQAQEWRSLAPPPLHQFGGALWSGEPLESSDWSGTESTEVLSQASSISQASTSSSAQLAAATNSSQANTYPVGQCTWGVKALASWASNAWGNGGDWAANAAADGFSIGTEPVVGAIAVWTDGGYGHVAYVTDVVSSTSIQVLEANVNGNQTIANHRGYFDPTTAQGTVSYIYPAT